jgi:TPR repeat protein
MTTMKTPHASFAILFLGFGLMAGCEARNPEAAGTQEAAGELQKAHETTPESDAVEADKPEEEPVHEPKDEFLILQEKAESGDAEAQAGLALRYANGQGVVKNEPKAVEWYRKAAEQGVTAAQYNLGLCYTSGRGMVKDEKEAVKWVRKAAEQGNTDAQNTFGYYYATGRGVIKDEKEAVKWYRLAAEQGNAWAQYNLGKCYYNGEGVSKDATEAVK